MFIFFHFSHFMGRDKITNFMHMSSSLEYVEDVLYTMKVLTQ